MDHTHHSVQEAQRYVGRVVGSKDDEDKEWLRDKRKGGCCRQPEAFGAKDKEDMEDEDLEHGEPEYGVRGKAGVEASLCRIGIEKPAESKEVDGRHRGETVLFVRQTSNKGWSVEPIQDTVLVIERADKAFCYSRRRRGNETVPHDFCVLAGVEVEEIDEP
jgi:hypothetical protein